MKKLSILSITVLLVLLTNKFANAQTQSITVDTTITADCEFDPFNSADAIYSLSINGSLTLNSDTSLVRVVLYDSLFNEYMVYESYPLIASEPSFNFYDVCDETCYLDGLSPYSLEVQIINATLILSSLSFEPNFINSADSLQTIAKQTVELQKAQQMQDFIDQREMLWFADTNTISMMSYFQKKNTFGENYNLLGYDYYSGGIYISIASDIGAAGTSTLVPDWDWRKRHGANDPGKSDYYFDQNNLGDGWISEVKDQHERDGCTGLCYIYAPLAAVEGLTNIFLNRLNEPEFINYNLSEQHVLNCDEYDGDPPACSTQCWCGYATFTNTMFYTGGVFSQECFEVDDPGDCIENCPTAEYKIETGLSLKVDNLDSYKIKTRLIERGPLTAFIANYSQYGNHYMALVGYGTIKAGDVFQKYPEWDIIVVEEGSQYIGLNYWIFKNSLTTNWGFDGYAYHSSNQLMPGTIWYYTLPINDLVTPEDEEPLCRDEDNDGYWNWGIQQEIASDCPEGCNEFKDSDDSNPRLGPFDEDYYSIPVAPIMEVYDDATPTPKIIPNNTFYSFYDASLPEQITLSFNIVNNGDAQLNLVESNEIKKTIEISGDVANDFVLDDDDLELIIPMGGGSTSFNITLTAPINPPKIATVTIHVMEDDMDDYVFTLVFTDCSLPNAEIEILTDPVVDWDSTMVKFGDVLVSQGTILNVTGNVAFKAGASLIIERGGIRDEETYDIEPPAGKVYVDGGLLTSFCGDNWDGVDVWGYKDESQYPDQEGDYSQGYIKLTNGGTISNALVGIETIRKNNDRADIATSGGIVIINNGTIENCNIGVKLYEYTNFWPDPQHQVPNFSGFIEAHFINDKNCSTFKQLYLEKVNGIGIRGCSFENLATPSPLSDLHYGIFSDGSGFTVTYKDLTPWISPPTEILKSSFKNLDKAIYATNSNSFRPYISHSVFEDNKRGIYLSQVNYPVIIKNEFNVRKRFSFFPESVEMIGLYINDDSEGYVIEENEFYSELRNTELQTTTCEGITLNNTGQKPNEVYNNSFNSLSAGIVAAGENRDDEGAGLCIKCNDFRDCLFDIWVIPEKDENGDPIIGPTIGIAEEQGLQSNGNGNPTLAAGNTFSKRNDDLGVVNYKNLVDWNDIYYTHHSTDEQPKKIKPLPYTIGDVIPIEDFTADYSKELSCPSNYNGGGIDKAATTSTYSTELLSVSAYEDSLSTLVDGGDTEDLAWDVNMSTPPEAADVRQELLDESPYLSDTVMKTAITKEDVLPNAMIRDVLVANPQSAKSVEILRTLNQRNDTMPAYMMSQIMQGVNTIGAKELLEQQLAGHKTKKGKAMTRLMHYYLVDTVNYSVAIDSMFQLLENDNELSSQYQLTMKYIGMKDSASAYSTFYDIPNDFYLNGVQEDEYDLYEDLIDLQWQMMNDTVTPDSTVIDALFDIEQYVRTTPGVYARNILISLGELDYQEPVYVPDFNKSAPINLPFWSEEVHKENLMKLFPNPAGIYFIMEHDLREYDGEITMQVISISGIVIESVALQNKQNQTVITTRNYPSGIYIVQLLVDGLMMEADKITIIK